MRHFVKGGHQVSLSGNAQSDTTRLLWLGDQNNWRDPGGWANNRLYNVLFRQRLLGFYIGETGFFDVVDEVDSHFQLNCNFLHFSKTRKETGVPLKNVSLHCYSICNAKYS